MRRAALSLLRCPACRRAAPLPETDEAEVRFGPLRCPECGRTYPVSDGIVDLSVAEDVFREIPAIESKVLARTYERQWRPALLALATFERTTPEDEYETYYRLLNLAPGDAVLDVACGTGLFARKLAGEPNLLAIGAEPSRAMLEEGRALAREETVWPEFVRTPIPPLPFADQAFGGVLQGTSVHLLENPRELFREVRRVLRPGGRYVMSTVSPAAPVRYVAKRGPMKLYLRREDEWADLLLEAGLARVDLAASGHLVVLCSERAEE